MPFSLRLCEPWATLGWKAKIREDERNEEPHVSILFKLWTWRLSLRTGEFLDAVPPPRNVPAGMVEWIWCQRELLRARWDEKYPENVVFSQKED
ncbi:MAG TPA: hypothetical protein VM890_04320 [Longimicrobium sp.]|jgi:hypothetical protein|nr:hypothetical protein [Longimicrobium sp.]